MVMNCKRKWEEMKDWLETKIEDLAIRKDELAGEFHQPESHKEYYRVKGKLAGLKVALAHMEQSELLEKEALATDGDANENDNFVFMLKSLLDVSCNLDSAYLRAATTGGESSFNGEEYDKLNDVMADVEEFLEGK